MGQSGFGGKIEGTRSLGGLRHGLEDHHRHISVMELGHFLTRSGLTYPEVYSKVYHDSFCHLGSSSSVVPSCGIPCSHKRGNDHRVTAV